MISQFRDASSFVAFRKVNSLAVDGWCRQIHLPHATFSHVQSLHRTAQMTCVHWLKLCAEKAFLHPRITVHPLLHATLSTSSFYLSCVVVVLFSEPRPVVHVSNHTPLLHRHLRRWFRLRIEGRTNTWQLISVNINRQRSSDISVIKEKLLGPARVHAHVPVIFSIQETKSWDVTNLKLLGYVCHVIKFGFATLLVSKQLGTTERSWRHEERCTAVLFGTTLMVAYASDSSKSMGMYEAVISSVLGVLREGRRGAARDFHISGDLNVAGL